MLHRLRNALGRGRLSLRPRTVEPAILLYHRVADVAVDPWSLAVSPGRFDQQMAWLNRHRSPMALGELVERLRRGTVPRDAVAVTFDDGYVDNLVNAKPLLERYRVPATLFLATGGIGRAEEFWWDELAKLTIGRAEASAGSLEIAGSRVAWSFPAATGRMTRGASAEARDQAYRLLWGALRGLPAPAVRQAMAELRRIIGIAPRNSLDRAMTTAEIAGWLAGGLTEIAAHTVTHLPLTVLTPDEIEDEVASSMAYCADLSGKMVRGFAYPYGDRNEAVAAAVRRAGVEWACSTHPALLPSGRDIDYFDLPRIQVASDEFSSQRRDWR